MVNPSTADATADDATIRKLRGFGERNGWGRIAVGNKFAFRATDIRALVGATDAVGPDNDVHLRELAGWAQRVVYAWGPLAKLPKHLRGRWRTVDHIFRDAGHDPLCIGVPASDGQPRHPLMLSYGCKMQSWIAPAAEAI